MIRTHHLILVVLGGVAWFATGAYAKDKAQKKTKAAPQDQIAVVGHIPASSGPVIRFLATPHYSRYYLYAEHDGGQGVTLIDVTAPERPSVIAGLAYGGGGTGSLLAATGTAALVTSEQPASVAGTVPQTIRIMSFADPAHPVVAHEFTGVTAITRDDARGLIFIANPEGVWILQQQLALDPELEAAYAHQLMYAR